MQYVGITGFMARAEVDAALDALPPGLTLMCGVLVSAKTLRGERTRWWRRYPRVEDVAAIFSDDPRCLNLIHYCGEVVDGAVIEHIRRVGGPLCHGAQFNGAWPTERLIGLFGTVVLQYRPAESDPALLRRLVSAGGIERVHVLIDGSQGRGEALDIVATERRIDVLRGWVSGLRLGVAGGLCADTLPGVADIVCSYDLSTDAEGRLRDEADGGGNLHLGKVGAWLQANGELLRERCAACGQPAQGNFSLHRDGLFEGPEVPLCDGCGGGRKPTLEELWARIAARRRAAGELLGERG